MLAALCAAFTGRRPPPRPPAATPHAIGPAPEPAAATPELLLAAADSRSGSRPAAARRSRHPDPVAMPLAAHVAALQTWAADIARLPDGAVLAAELADAYREMCGEHNWTALHWDLVAAALRAEAGLVKRYAWISTEAGARRLCVYDLPSEGQAARSRPNFKAAKAAGQPRGTKGRFASARSASAPQSLPDRAGCLQTSEGNQRAAAGCPQGSRSEHRQTESSSAARPDAGTAVGPRSKARRAA